MHALRHPHLAAAPHRRPGTDAPVRDLRAWFTTRSAAAARAELAHLVEEAVALDLDDTTAVADLRERARRHTARLAAAGALPPHLAVAADDPGIVVVRTLAAAMRGVTPGPVQDASAR